MGRSVALAVRVIATIALAFGFAIAAARYQLAIPWFVCVVLSVVLLVEVATSDRGWRTTLLLAIMLGAFNLFLGVWLHQSPQQSEPSPVGFPPTPVDQYVLVAVVALGLGWLAVRVGQSVRHDRSPTE